MAKKKEGKAGEKKGDEKEGLRSLLGFSAGDYESMLSLAADRYSEGDFQHAETILLGLMALDETDSRPVKVLASTMLLRERHREAEALYERAYLMDPNDPYTLVALGELKLRTLRIKEAVPLFEKLFAQDPQGKHPAANRGREVVKAYYQKIVAG